MPWLFGRRINSATSFGEKKSVVKCLYKVFQTVSAKGPFLVSPRNISIRKGIF